MVDGIVAYSELNNPEEAIEDILKQISKKGNPILIIFSSAEAPFKTYTERLKKAFPKAEIMGCTTFTSLSSKGNGENALVAWAITSGVAVASGVLLEITHYPMKYSERIEKALTIAGRGQNTICIDFCTAAGNCEELVQDTFRSVLEKEKIPVAGATAGATNPDATTYVSLNGEVYEEAAVFLMIKNLTGKVFIYKENIFRPTDLVVTATDVDCEERVVYEYDNMPALVALASKLGVKLDKVVENLVERPLGRITGHDIYITDMRGLRDDGSITYYARIYNQTKLNILEPDDLDAVWKRTAQDVKAVIPKPSMSYAINCYTRVLFFERHNRMDSYNEVMKKEYGQYAGIATFGEQVHYEHFNATMVLVVFE
ncbi:MAG: FIST C-terminal domain-containing protein [Lachnospiraceae bacterium]|nr:FIST C-terminal domain-containing protein [Lachnospiraceae bacterium]